LREENRLRVFENRVLRGIFGPKMNKVTGEWRKLHIKELNYLYSSPNITQVIKSKRITWAGNVAPMGRGKLLTGSWWRNLKERGHLEDPGVDGRIIFFWYFRKYVWGVNWNDLAQVRYR
jgi:hypothetical protein